MIFLYKITTVLTILLLLLYQRIGFLAIQLRKDKKFQDTWLRTSVVKWGDQLCAKIRLKCETSNREILDSLDWSRNIFLVSNHQSYLDIAAIYVSTQRMFGFLAKYELGMVPFLSFWMRIQGCIFINRARYREAIRYLKKLENQKKPLRLVLFPEGTRSKTGKLGKLKSGALKLAWQLDGILVPTIIQGTRQAWEDRKKIFHQHPAKIRFDKTIDIRKVKETHSFKEFLADFEQYFQGLHEKS